MKKEDQTSGSDFSKSKLRLALIDRSIELYLKKDIYQQAEALGNNVLVQFAEGTDAQVEIPQIIVTQTQTPYMIQGSSNFIDEMVSINEQILERANYSLEDLVKYRQGIVAQLKENAVAPQAAPRNHQKSVMLNKSHLELIDIALNMQREQQQIAKGHAVENEVVIELGDTVQFYDEIVAAAVQIVEAVQKYMATDIKGREALIDEIAYRESGVTANYSLNQLINAREGLAAKLESAGQGE